MTDALVLGTARLLQESVANTISFLVMPLFALGLLIALIGLIVVIKGNLGFLSSRAHGGSTILVGLLVSFGAAAIESRVQSTGSSSPSSKPSPTPSSDTASVTENPIIDITHLGPPVASEVAAVPVPQVAFKVEGTRPSETAVLYELRPTVKRIELNRFYGTYMPPYEGWNGWEWCSITVNDDDPGHMIQWLYQKGQPPIILSVTTTEVETRAGTVAAVVVDVSNDGKSCKP